MAVGTYTLVALSDINAYLGYTTGADTARDNLLEKLADRATTMMENYCDRKFKSRTYRNERYDGDGSEWLFLDNFPIISINRIGIGTRKALDIQCTDDSATFASIDLDADSLTITQIGGTNEGSSDLAFNTYSTVSALAAAVNGLANWEAEVATDMGSYPASDLLDVWGQYCLDTKVGLYVINEALNDFSVWRDGGKQIGVVYRSAGWTAGVRNIIVTYTAGYTTIPEDLKQICIELAATLYNRRNRDWDLVGETLGDYTWRAGAGASRAVIPPHLQSALGPYRRIPIVG